MGPVGLGSLWDKVDRVGAARDQVSPLWSCRGEEPEVGTLISIISNGLF
jgi:hypothetical protein